MREIIDLRLLEDVALKYLPDDVGELLSPGVRRVLISTDDPLFQKIGRIENELWRERPKAQRQLFVASWRITRYYDRQELESAVLLVPTHIRVMSQYGEEYGTQYDDSRACPICGAGAVQSTPLFLNGRKLPKRGDVAMTFVPEFVVSRKFVTLVQKGEFTGARFEPVRLAGKQCRCSEDWFQPIPTAPPVRVHSNTRTGEDPFDTTCYGRCPRGDTLGLNLLSELWVDKTTYEGHDIVWTEQYFGHREGVLRPYRLMLVSQRLWRAMDAAHLRGFRIEVVHMA